MAEAELHEPGERRRERRKAVLKRLTVVNAVFILVVIILAGVSVSLLRLADDYHDAKYKAQYELVSDLLGSLLTAEAFIHGMTSPTTPDYERLGQSVYAYATMASAQNSALAIAVMYPDGSRQSSAFNSIERALGQAGNAVYRYENKLYGAFQLNASYHANSTINNLYVNLTEELGALFDLVAAGRDDSRDWMQNPYSLVSRMDLAAIEDVCSIIEATSEQIAEMQP